MMVVMITICAIFILMYIAHNKMLRFKPRNVAMLPYTSVSSMSIRVLRDSHRLSSLRVGRRITQRGQSSYRVAKGSIYR